MRSAFRLFSAVAVFGLAMAAGPVSAEPAETPVPPSARTGLTLTIYGNDLALVTDRREVVLKAGDNRLAIQDISAQILPETVLIRDIPYRITEKMFDVDTATTHRLLDASLGQEVTVVRRGAAGENAARRGKLIGVEENRVVLEVDGRVEFASPSRIRLDSLPAGVRLRPTLVLGLAKASEGKQAFSLNYLTGGLSWTADYVAELSERDATLDITGWATIANATGTEFPDVRIGLVAGDLHRISGPGEPRAAKMMTMRATPEADVARPERLEDYQLYSVEAPVTLGARQTKQMSLRSDEGIDVERRYVHIGQPAVFHAAPPPAPPTHPEIRLAFENTRQPMPAGVVRVYSRDRKGQLRFIGEDRVANLPPGETVRLTLGRAFDISVERRQTDFRKVAANVHRSTHEIEIRSARDAPVTVTVVEPLPGDWTIEAESHDHEKEDGRAVWNIPVPTNGRAMLTYTVEVRN